VPLFRNFVDFQVLRGIRAFLSLEAGIVRGTSPVIGGRLEQNQSKDLEIKRLRRKLGKAHEELAELKAADSTGNLRDGVPIFFVVGSPKSGTTWFSRMLNQHPEVLCRGEGSFFGRNDRNETFDKVQVNKLGQLLRPGSLYNTLAEYDDLRIWIERTWWSRDADVEEHIAHLTRDAVRYFLTRKLAKTGKRIVGDKTPLQSVGIVREIDAMLPEAKVIHVIRDGRDVTVSHTHHRWNRVRPVEEGGRLTPEDQDKRDRYRKNPEEFVASGESIFSEEYFMAFAKGWRSKVGNTHRDGQAVLGDRYTEVRYEDLLERPEEEMARLFRFVGASDDKDVVRRCVDENRFEKLSGRPEGSEDSTSFYRKGVAGDWQSVFTKHDRQLFWQLAGDLLVELGYEKGPNQ
jgi:Sulfotransferase domain